MEVWSNTKIKKSRVNPTISELLARIAGGFTARLVGLIAPDVSGNRSGDLFSLAKTNKQENR